MPQPQNRHALEDLKRLTRRLQVELERAEETSRFRRSPDRAAEFAAQLERTRSHLELALDALAGEDLRAGGSGGGWLASRVGGLVRYLTKDEAPTTAPFADRAATASTDAEDAEGSLVGDCACMPVPDLLAALQGQGKTGVLRFTHAEETFVLHLAAGQLVHAYSERTPEGKRLGEILVRRGSLTPERLRSILFCKPSGSRKIGDILIEGDVVSREELEGALTEQVQGLFDRLFVVAGARFRFQPGLPEVEENRAQLNLMQLLLESARHEDERLAG